MNLYPTITTANNFFILSLYKFSSFDYEFNVLLVESDLILLYELQSKEDGFETVYSTQKTGQYFFINWI